MKLRISFLLGTFLSLSCTGTLFEEIGTHLAAPIAVAVDTARLRAYVVNSNLNFEFTGSTLSVLDITDPAAPVLLTHPANPVSIPNFSGQIYLDTSSGLAHVPNRFSENSEDTTDVLLRINVDEASASFGAVDSFAGGENPFGIACCDASGRIYVVAAGGTLNVFDPADLSTSVQISLEIVLTSGELASGASSSEVLLLGSQAFVTNRAGRIYVINTAEVGDTTKNPIDSLILNVGDARGIATDGTLLYVVEGTEEAEILRVIDPATVTPVDPDTTAIQEIDVATIQTATVALGNNPNEIVVFKGKAYVTNQDDDTVTVIDLASNTVTTTISVGEEPFGMAAFTVGATDYLYVANLISNSISVIDLASNIVVNTFAP
jgi:YVTN family beta-propeller protein